MLLSMLLVTMVKFDKKTYRVNEDEGAAKFALVLTNPSSINIIVEVFNSNATAFGEYSRTLMDLYKYLM